MALVVLKFGGTSLGNTSRIKNICGIIKKYIDQSHTVVVVVSAMGGVTDQLVSLVRDLSPQATGAEYDVVVSSGENVSAGLVALALNNMGVDARSWLGWQLPIQVNGAHKNCEIDKICTDGILENIDSGVVPVIAGFQGARNNEIYTLGRGGTDTTAVAIAAAINADKCYIYTDVEGVFSSDPRIIPKVKKLDSISFAEILEMAENGAKVLHPKAVAIAMHNKTSVEVLSSFTANAGTVIQDDMGDIGDDAIKGISLDGSLVQLSLIGQVSKDYVQALLIEQGVAIKFINQSMHNDATKVQLGLMDENAKQAIDIIKNKFKNIEIEVSRDISLICIVGKGFAEKKYNVEKVFKIINHEGIDILSTEISEISIKLIVKSGNAISAVQAIHSQFGLDVDYQELPKEVLNENVS